jgi:hypothetical protein
MKRLIGAAAIAALVSALTVLSSAADTGDRMSKREIMREIAGKRIYLKVPLGGEFPLFYGRDGTVDGSGEALGLGRYMSPSDRGQWWVANDRLCQKWQEWYDGERQCFELTKAADGTLYWKRDDGLEGEARIGR